MNCYAGTCNAFDGSCVCDAEWYGSSFKAHCPGVCPCHDRGDVRHGTRLELCVQRDVRLPRLQRAKLSPLSSAFFVLGESADLDSEWTCKCTGSWTGARCDETTGECECYLQYQGSDCSEETTVTFLEPYPRLSRCFFSSASAGIPSAPLEPSPFMRPASTSPHQNNRSSCSKSAQRHGGEPTWDSTLRPDVDRNVPETSQNKLPIGTGRRSVFSHNIFR